MEVELIKANDPFDGSARRKIERLRVAAYCRVSTDDEDQIKSYNSMVTHYTELIQNNKDWIFSGIYADKAITGTKVDKRDEFQRLIQDCMRSEEHTSELQSPRHISYAVFCLNDTATTEIYTPLYTLSLHDALPILCLMTFRRIKNHSLPGVNAMGFKFPILKIGRAHV